MHKNEYGSSEALDKIKIVDYDIKITPSQQFPEQTQQLVFVACI